MGRWLRGRGLAVFAVAFLAFSYLPYLAPERAMDVQGQTIFWTVWCSTLIILCDATRERIEPASLLGAITAGRRQFAAFLATGAISGLCLDGPAQWLGKLWVYPFWTPAVYGSTFVLGFSAYWLLLAETYLLVKRLLRRVFPPPGPMAPLPYPAVWAAAGLGLAGAALYTAVRDYAAAGGYRFEVTVPCPVHASFRCFPLLMGGLWLLLEAAAAGRGRVSLLAAVGQGNWLPGVSVLVAGWGCGFLMETSNAARHFWLYTWWPWQQVAVCGVPIMVLLMWPLQYVVFLSVYRLFGGEDIWVCRSQIESSYSQPSRKFRL